MALHRFLRIDPHVMDRFHVVGRRLLPFGREHESEADHIGLIYMARAGYDPQESIRFWERMEQSGGAQPPNHSARGTR